MKKILVVLLIVAVAGGVFAQGNWSLSGKVEIGSYIDLNGVNDAGDEAAILVGSGYFQPYGYYGPINGQFVLGYNMDALGVTLTFNAKDWDPIDGGVTYDGGNYKLQASTNLARLIAGTSTGVDAERFNVGRLWGYYKLVDEIIHLEVAYNSRDTEFWISDKSAGFYDSNGTINQAGVILLSTFSNKDNTAGEAATFTKVDHHNYLLADVQLEGLSFGFMAPGIFGDTSVHDNALQPTTGNSNPDVWAPWGAVGFPRALNGKKKGYELIEDVLKGMIFGVKFQMSPVEFAAQLLMRDYGVYFGGKWFAGPVTVGLSFLGIMQDTNNETNMKVGGSVNYNAGAFGAAIKGFYAVYGDPTLKNYTQIGVEPSFFYNVIPSHLQFTTDVGFYFTNVYQASDKLPNESTVRWGVQPQLFWNFMGSGAGSYYSFGTGMIVRYRLLSDVTNALDVSFKFSF